MTGEDGTVLYFGYGSNLDWNDWSEWCLSRGFEPEGLTEVGPAWLPDYSMAFHYYSQGRGGGAADIVRNERGCAVPGVLFRLDQQALEAMDRKEGHPAFYERRIVHPTTPDGVEHEALTYTVVPAKIRDEHTAPTPGYEALIRENLERRGLPTNELDSALSGKGVHFSISQVFMYGTLMKGESRHNVVEKTTSGDMVNATCRGRLLNLGSFPGMIPDADSVVKGELYTFSEMSDILRRLDSIEGYLGTGRPDSLYTRAIVSVSTPEGSEWAWTYIYNGRDGSVIDSGDWRHRS